MTILDKIFRKSNKPSDTHIELGTMHSPVAGRSGKAKVSLLLARSGSVNFFVKEIDSPNVVDPLDSEKTRSNWQVRVRNDGDVKIDRKDYESKEVPGEDITFWYPKPDKTVLKKKDPQSQSIQLRLEALINRGALRDKLSQIDSKKVVDAVNSLRPSHARQL